MEESREETGEASSSFRVAIENNKSRGKEVECANRTSHIARPCPSAAGDYVDYRMIRNPPLPPRHPSVRPSLPGVTLDLKRRASRSGERPPVSSQRKRGSFFH